MREYSKLPPSFWTGAPGKQIATVADPLLRAHCQVVACYLESNRHANMLGLYELPVVYVSHECMLSPAEALAALEKLAEFGWARFDKDSGVVWVIDMARRQILGETTPRLNPGDKRIKGIQRLYALVPDNPYLLGFFERYRDVFAMAQARGAPSPQQELTLGGEPAAVTLLRDPPPVADVLLPHTPKENQGAEVEPKPLRSPLQAPPKPGAGAGTGAGEKEKTRPDGRGHELSTGSEQAVDKDAPKPIMHKQAGKSKGVLMAQSLGWFLAFWDAFDYKSGKMEAVGAWLDLEADGQITEATVTRRILPAARAEAVRRKAIEARKGTPKMAEGWLSARRYEDEALIGEDPETKRRKTASEKERETVRRRQQAVGRGRANGLEDALLEWRAGDTVEEFERRIDTAIVEKMYGGGHAPR